MAKNYAWKKFKAGIQNFGTDVSRGRYADCNKMELSSFKILGGLDLETWKWFFLGGGERTSHNFACSAGVQNYILYDIALIMLLYTLTIMLLYDTLTITLLYTLTMTLTIMWLYAYYDVTICYDITLLITSFDALPITINVCNFHTMLLCLTVYCGDILFCWRSVFIQATAECYIPLKSVWRGGLKKV